MASEEVKKMRMRLKFFQSFCSSTVASFITNDQTFTQPEKDEIIKIAREIARTTGHIRIYWDDFSMAIRKFREKSDKK